MAIGAYSGFHLKISRKGGKQRWKKSMILKGILGFILFEYAEKNKEKEMVRNGLVLEKIISMQAYSVTDIGKKNRKKKWNMVEVSLSP